MPLGLCYNLIMVIPTYYTYSSIIWTARYGLCDKSCTNINHSLNLNPPTGNNNYYNENYNIYYLEWYYEKYYNMVNDNDHMVAMVYAPP